MSSQNKLKVVIDRATWQRGCDPNRGLTKLLNDKNQRCCLGFLMRDLGYSDDELFSKDYPGNVSQNDRKLPCLISPLFENVGGHSDFVSKAIQLNDDTKINSVEREYQLTKLFAKEEIELVFEN